MQAHEAKILLGFPIHFHPTASQVKEAYKSKVWETHPDRFPIHEKAQAECKFKLINEAYSCLKSGGSGGCVHNASYSHVVVRRGYPRTNVRRGNRALTSVPYFLIILGALTLGGSTASRAYRRQKEANPSYNPFLP